jgi:hypothetical protein
MTHHTTPATIPSTTPTTGKLYNAQLTTTVDLTNWQATFSGIPLHPDAADPLKVNAWLAHERRIKEGRLAPRIANTGPQGQQCLGRGTIWPRIAEIASGEWGAARCVGLLFVVVVSFCMYSVWLSCGSKFLFTLLFFEPSHPFLAYDRHWSNRPRAFGINSNKELQITIMFASDGYPIPLRVPGFVRVGSIVGRQVYHPQQDIW